MQTSPMKYSADRKDTIKWFFDVLDSHEERIQRTKSKVDSIYAFRTPDTPYFEYALTDPNTSAVTPFEYKAGAWVETEYDNRLDGALQRIAYYLKVFPQNDYVPSIHPGHGRSDLIPGLYGCDFDYTPEGAVINKNYRITDLGSDIDGFLAENIDLAADPIIAEQVEYARFASEAVEGRVQIVYPQLQGLLTNSMRLMEQTEMLMACVTDKPNMVRLSERIAEHMIGIVKLMLKATGSPKRIRPRGRFHQPSGVVGLMVDDYISVIRPQDYFDICNSSWQMMADELGPIYMHTCGPVAQDAEILLNLPGLVGLETAFVDHQHTTTVNVMDMKKRLEGRIVLGTFGLPHGEPVQDIHNLSRAWLDTMSEGGGYMMHASGTYNFGRHLFEKLAIGG
jgi:hypothetical protein